MARAPVLLHHPSSLEHDTGAHPEQAARIPAVLGEIAARGGLGWERRESSEVADADLLAVHPANHVEAIERAAAAGGSQLDPDTIVSAGSYRAARHAAGGAVGLVDALLDGAPAAFSVHRPPGHHATADIAMGFCLFNSVAVAARHAIRERGLERVLVLDWDVHHGNGTEAIFLEDPAVLFVSIHQWPLYPGTGSAAETGRGAGEGSTVNLPVPAGSGDDVFVSLVAHVAVPLMRVWAPQLILISAGYDAHRDDPLADCVVTDEGYASMAACVAAAAGELGAPVGAVLEGGYALGALGRGVAVTMTGLAEPGASWISSDGDFELHELSITARRRLAPHWGDLG